MNESEITRRRLLWPIIEALRSLGGSGRPPEVYEWIVQNLNISDQALSVLTPQGERKFNKEVRFARQYLKDTGYLDSSRHGVWQLTTKGRFATRFTPADVQAIIDPRGNGTGEVEQTGELGLPDKDGTQEPDDQAATFRDELLMLLRALPSAGFERLCQRLLTESGFEQVVVTGRSSDGGIDGHGVLVNPIVSFKVLFQCKRYADSVSPSQVHDFRGAMMGRADKGIIVTTGTFTAEAQREALRDGVPPIELVNGEKLMDLFESLELGLKPRKTYDVDYHFFDEFRS